RTTAVTHSIFFFFQAEDGIRDWSVTGVQTCALPIYFVTVDLKVEDCRRKKVHRRFDLRDVDVLAATGPVAVLERGQDGGHDEWRSEERRVGKECRSRWGACE